MHRLDYITSLNSYLVSQQLTSKQTVLNGQLISQEEEAYKQQIITLTDGNSQSVPLGMTGAEYHLYTSGVVEEDLGETEDIEIELDTSAEEDHDDSLQQ
ncbi:uncharacterized protein LOC135144439 isoform X3 [Zophobas morio]|uniref:uncharacterized protein LOC135144439 isoform X2 n=1 Tax=Zophobas morio TaxID=2755281 RepID=UPI0030835393